MARIDPFAALPEPVPVTIVTAGALPHVDDATALVMLEPPLHEHAAGDECAACSARGDIRAILFDLLTEMRLGLRPSFSAVVVDGRKLTDIGPIAAGLSSGAPALGLRDHTVAKSFRLVDGA